MVSRVTRCWLIIAGNRPRSSYRVLHTTSPGADADTVITTNGGSSWPTDVYIKPELEIIPLEPAARSTVDVSALSKPTTSVDGSSFSSAWKNCDERRTTMYDVKRDDVPTRSKTLTSPEIDRRPAAIEQRLTAVGSAGNGYKYKDNIKRRFCSEGDIHAPSNIDTISYSSLSDCASSVPECSPPSSPGAPAHNAAVQDDYYRRTVSTADTAAAEHSPGFVLHPSGAYYLPVIMATAPMTSTSNGQQFVCHPVSIPVRFTGSCGDTTAQVVSVDEAVHRPVQFQSLLQLQHLWINLLLWRTVAQLRCSLCMSTDFLVLFQWVHTFQVLKSYFVLTSCFNVLC